MKQKTCKLLTCKKKFTPTQFAQVVCGWQCSIGYDKQKKAKKAAKEHTVAKKEFRLSDKSLQKKLTQALVNKFVRLRDASEPCISCGTYTGQMQAGHYRSVGSHPHLRYNTRNIFKQCARCNSELSANLIEFRISLVRKFGTDYVESLEADQTPRQFNNEQVILIGQYYKGMIKEMES
jgi:hypothetical protein